MTAQQPSLLPKLVLFELQPILFLFSLWNGTNLCDFPKELITKYPAVTHLISCHTWWNPMVKDKHSHGNLQNKGLKQDFGLAIVLKTNMALMFMLLNSLTYHQSSRHFTHFEGKIFLLTFSFSVLHFFTTLLPEKK